MVVDRTAPPYLPPGEVETHWEYEWPVVSCDPPNNVGGWPAATGGDAYYQFPLGRHTEGFWTGYTGGILGLSWALYDFHAGEWVVHYGSSNIRVPGDCNGFTYSVSSQMDDYSDPYYPGKTYTSTTTWAATFTRVEACPAQVTVLHIADGITVTTYFYTNPYL